ncbi:TPA: DUF551 domain-containing protein [Escherichia coli]|nr:DUF551 domain-containing protein [Escherichia coli]
MTTITNKKQYPSEQYLNELITNIEFAARAPVEVVRAMAAELQKRREADSAEPVAYIFKHPAGKLFWALTDESNKEQADVIPVYAAPPVPVVPEEKTMPNPLKMYAVDAVAAIAEVRGWNACRAAMLHGAEPVSQTYKLPPMSSNEVNDAAWKLRNMLTEHGPLNGLQFNNLKECFYEALKVAMRNYPVTPDGWISCSERMPDTKTAVLVAVEFGRKGDWRMKWATYIPGHPDANDGWIIPGASWKPSHWMPLPEPPQEVN